MTRLIPLAVVLLAATGGLHPPLAQSDDPKPAAKDGFVPLFNGRDLTGWVNVNCAPGTFFVKDNEIVTTGNPTGFLRTEKQYENFELEFEWMHVEPTRMANSGLFVWGDPLPAVGTPYTRGIEVQVLINYKPADGWATSHGDLFSIWGAKCVPDRPHPKGIERCLPSEERVKGGGQWNHYRVVANDGVIKLSVNGKEVSGVSMCNPRKGYLALESEGAECHFRKLVLKELPTTNPKPDEVAKVAEGHVSLFTGIDLSGWKTETDAWKAGGGVLRAAGEADLVSEKEFARCEVVFDWRLPNPAPEWEVTVAGIGFKPGNGKKPGEWNRTAVSLTETGTVGYTNGRGILTGPGLADPPRGPIRFRPAAGLEVMNVFVRELKGK